MIQEISDYLLIRSLLYNSSSEELLEAAQEKENFIYLLDNIYALMQEEDFIFVAPHLVTNVEDLIQKYRFDYNKDKELNDKINYIIGRLNDYKNMSDERKEFIVNNWVVEESKQRNFPMFCMDLETLLECISLDFAYFQGIIQDDTPFVVSYVAEYISIINIILNKYPECLDEDYKLLMVTKENLIKLKGNKKISIFNSIMLNKTLKKMCNIYPQLELKKNSFQKLIKRTEK